MRWVEVVEGIVTQAPDRHEQVTKSHGPHRGEAGYRGKGHKGQRASVTWKGGGPGAMQEGSRMTRTTPKTTITTQHQTAGGRRGVKWRIERKTKQRWKLTEVNHIKQITRKRKKRLKTSTQLKVWQAAAEDKRCLIIRKENMSKIFWKRTQNNCYFADTGT